jgi:hypothetical protein
MYEYLQKLLFSKAIVLELVFSWHFEVRGMDARRIRIHTKL